MIPVVVLTGFLGSGKTSLLNRMLAARQEQDSDRKIAIIVNEFGDVGIDGDLLPSDMTRQVELPGGCICCVLNEDLDKTLIELVEGVADLEMIVVETTGIAEPLPISWSLAAEPVCDYIRLASVVTVVDALNFCELRTDSPAVDAQVEYGDILVTSKLDQASEAQAEAVYGDVRSLNEHAPVYRGAPAQAAAWVWDILRDPPMRTAPRQAPTPSHRHNDYQAVSSTIEDTLDLEELESLLQDLPANYVRIKGICRGVDEGRGWPDPVWVAFHRVGTRVSIESASPVEVPRIVGLGRGIDRAQLAACVRGAVVRS